MVLVLAMGRVKGVFALSNYYRHQGFVVFFFQCGALSHAFDPKSFFFVKKGILSERSIF